MEQRIAVFGGSFNPVHIAHIMLTRKISDELRLDRIFVIPTYLTPLKDNAPMVSAYHRLEMCKLAWEQEKNVTVDDIEIRRGGKSYTSETLEEFSLTHKGDKLFLAVGADMFLTLPQWHNSEKIFELAEIVTVPRDENDYKTLLSKSTKYRSFGARCTVLKEPVMQLSSTMIRDKLKSGVSVSGIVPEKVLSYITANNLYME